MVHSAMVGLDVTANRMATRLGKRQLLEQENVLDNMCFTKAIKLEMRAHRDSFSVPFKN